MTSLTFVNPSIETQILNPVIVQSSRKKQKTKKHFIQNKVLL